ncbi:MAG: hypothetical protein JWN14_3276 [Chthonomonadales bacterium]|nr:hypothetical protein [Chthonomonadales bacterium]
MGKRDGVARRAFRCPDRFGIEPSDSLSVRVELLHRRKGNPARMGKHFRTIPFPWSLRCLYA